MSVAVAQPTISVNGTTDVSTSQLGITWGGADSTGSNSGTDVYYPAIGGGTKPIQNIVFNYGGTLGHSGDETNYTITSNTNQITFNSGGKGIEINNTGNGLLKLDLGENTGKSFTLNLNTTSSADFSFKGNLQIVGGKEIDYETDPDAQPSNTFTANLNNKFDGSITIGEYTASSFIKANVKADFHFDGDTGKNTITGDIKNYGGIANFYIKNGQTLTINGGILTDRDSVSVNTFTFAQGGSSANLTVEKGIYAHWPDSKNIVDLGSGTLTINNGSLMAKDGTNKIIVGNLNITAKNLNFIGGPHTNDGYSIFVRQGGTNDITISGANATLDVTKKNSSDTSAVGGIFASGGDNFIRFTNSDGNGKVNGTIMGSGSGRTTIFYNKADKEIDSETKIDFAIGEDGGQVFFGFTDDLKNNHNKTFTFDMDRIISTDTAKNAKGIVGFQGMSKVILTGGDLKSNTVFLYDRDLIDNYTNGTSILDGNIIANGVSAVFGFEPDTSENPTPLKGSNPFDSDTTNNTPPTKTYTVNGNITITDGGLSAFWEDGVGFLGKLGVTASHTITFNGGLIGRNNLWFGTNGISTVSTIQATVNGESHLVFDGNLNITGKDETVDTNQEKIAIKASGGNTGMILFKGATTINGKIKAQSNGKNIIAFAKGATLSAGSNGLSVEIVDSGQYDKSYNALMFNGAISSVTLDSVSINGQWPQNPKNILSFNASGNSITIKSIGVSKNGTNLIGKNLLAQDGFSTAIFGSTNNPSGGVNTKNFLSDTYQAEGTFVIGEATKNAIQAGPNGKNYININGNTTIKGNILSSYTHTANDSEHNNIIVLGGTSAKLGEDSSNQISIKVNNASSGAWNKYSHNAILLNATTNTLNLSELFITGDTGANAENKTFNILSLNTSSNTGDKNIATVSATSGSNFIGKDLITQSEGYNTSIFGSNINAPLLQNGFVTEFIKDTHQAKGTFVFGVDTSSNAFSTSKNGKNYVNINGSTTIKGNILSSVASFGNSGASGHDNLLILTGTLAEIGQVSNKVSIEVNNGETYNYNSNNVILLGATTNTLNLSQLRMRGAGSDGLNILSFNASSGNTANIDSLEARLGSNVVAKNMIVQNTGYDTTLFGSNASTPRIQSNFFDNFKSSNYRATGTYTFTNITANYNGNNYVNVDQLTINGTITAYYGKNYLVAGTLRGNGKVVATASGSNNIIATGGSVTFEGISTETQAVSGNTINLGSGSITINTRSGGNADGKAVYAWNGENSNSIAASKIIVNGDIVAGGANNATNSFTTDTSIEVIGNISGGGQNNFTLTSGTATLTLNGKTQAVASETTTKHDITSLTATASGTNTLTLDNTNPQNGTVIGAMETTIHSITNGSNLDVVLKGQSGKGATLILDNATGTTLRSVSLGSSSSDNAITFSNGANKILTAINAEGSKLTINLQGARTSLNLAGFSKGTGEANLSVSGAGTNATISGGNIDATELTFGDNAKLSIQNSSATFASATGSGTIGVGGGANATNVTIDALSGASISANFNGQGAGREAVLIIKGNSPVTLANLSVENGSTHNTLDFSSLTTASITNAVNVASGQGLIFKLANTALTFGAGLTSSETTTIRVENATTGATLSATSGSLGITNLDMVGNGKTKVTFESNTTIGTLNAQANGGNELVVGKTSATTSLTIGTTNSTLSSVELAGTSATLNINGGKQSIGTLTTGATDKTDTTKGNILSFANNTISIGEISNASSNQINLTLDNSTLSLGKDATIKKLEVKSGSQATIDLSGSNTKTRVASARKTLTIGSNGDTGAFSGNLNTIVYASKTTADKIVVNGTGSTGSITIFAKGDINEILSITYDDKVQVAEIENSSTNGNNGTNNITVKGGISEINGMILDLVVQEDKNNKGNYYIGKTVSKGVDTSIQEVASSALTVNYDLYLANFNSLNKRMGELRDNSNNNGLWARVFGGNMSNDFGSGSKTDYVTAQAGYDYSLTFGDAKNYIGIAVAYGKSWTKSNKGVGLSTASLDNVNSSMVEVGVYNSYVADNGWYNDTILKFDYIMSDFTLKTSGNTANNSTNNFAMILSDEFGYRYKFAENEKGNWYIDPQVEVAFGYFNQSDFNHALTSSGNVSMKAVQDSILTLRSRAGLSLGKKFNTERGFASLYVGAFYEYDYIEGGNAQTQTTGVDNPLDKVESNGRAILNVGSNIGLTESARLYIDVEKSFGDKQRTFMQFNLGARYSF